MRQRFEGRSSLYDWKFEVPTLGEIINWQISYFNATQRLVGIYPELKHPDWYNAMVSKESFLSSLYLVLNVKLYQGYPMEDLLIAELASAGYHTNDEGTPRDLSNVVPVAIQCFKNSSLKYLATISNIPLVQLMGISNEQPDSAAVYTESILDDVMTYASAVGPDKKLFTTDWGVGFPQAMRMRSWASSRGLFFVPWSFQQEVEYIPAQFEGDAKKEMLFFYACLQSTAIFHEFPDQAREVVAECQEQAEKDQASSCLSLCPYL